MVTLGVSLFIAAIANFDVINITVRLWETSKYTELLALYEKTGQTLKIDPNLFTMLPVGWYINNLPVTFIEWVLKIIGIFLGAFFIAIGSQYTYNLFKNSINLLNRGVQNETIPRQTWKKDKALGVGSK